MNRALFIVSLVLGLFVFSVSVSAGEFKYVGVKTCKKCHKKKKVGEQYGIWKKSEHSKTYALLASEDAKEAAAKIGVSDPQNAKECLICHTAARYDKDGNEQPKSMFIKKFDWKDGTQCEVCHGPGEKYAAKKKVMKKIAKEGGKEGNSATAKATGLIFPDENTCKRCHVSEIVIGGVTYKNPSFKSFDFEKRFKKIAHHNPQHKD